MKYEVIRTDTADSLIRKAIMEFGENPYIGEEPRYNVLRRQGYLYIIRGL